MKGNRKRNGTEKTNPKAKRSQKCHWRINEQQMNIYSSERPTTIKLPTAGHFEDFLSCNFRYFVPSSRQFYKEKKKQNLQSAKFEAKKYGFHKQWIKSLPHLQI